MCQLIERTHACKAPRTTRPSVRRWQPSTSKTFLTPYSVTKPLKRPRRNQGEWKERGTRDTMPTCPPSPLFLPSPPRTPLPSLLCFAGRNSPISFTRADGSIRSFSSPDSKQHQIPNPLSGLYWYTCVCVCVCIHTFIYLVSQPVSIRLTRLPLFHQYISLF